MRRPVIFSALLALSMWVVLATGGAAQATGSIEIHKRVCPAGTTGNVFTECHDNLPEQPVSFSLDGGDAQLINEEGNVTFTGLAAGTYEISEVEGIPLEFVNLKVYCSVQDDDPEAFAVTTDGPNFSVTVGDGETIVCDVYNVAENLSGLTPTATPAPTATPSIVLPNTGSGPESDSGLPFIGWLAMVSSLLAGFAVLAVRLRGSNANR